MLDRLLSMLESFKKLPPEFRIPLAIVIFFLPFGAYGLIQSAVGNHWLAAGILFGFIFGIGLLIFLVNATSRAVTRRRERRMQDFMSSDQTTGPVNMSDRETIRANNKKFFDAIRLMKKDKGVRVYELPWQIVVGDSGCGKTRLVKESGLTLAEDVPDGYQLGTLNYNWWFTPQMILIDMAGRLCNPQEDKDRREWNGFLKTIAKGRPACPINGAVVCVSAEHLLKDSSDEVSAQAENMRLRLRELQMNLEVTFPVYLVVTKCDLVVGFTQLFEKHGFSPSLRTQMTGWSRPGEFNAPYNPEDFQQQFDALYARMHELRLRRLHEEDRDAKLEAAYCFPEEFAKLREPLQTYVSTLFPQMRSAKGARPLLFRGVYFTSATQTGSLMTDHLVKELGEEAVAGLKSLERMIEKPQPHFLKDLLLKKVCPEEGLVYKNEGQLRSNRRLVAGLLYGTLAMVGLGGFGAYRGCNRLTDLLGGPGKHAIEAAGGIDRADFKKLEAGRAMELQTDFTNDLTMLESGAGWLRLFSIFGVGASNPKDDLPSIRADLFALKVMPAAHERIANMLRTHELKDLNSWRSYEAAILAYAEILCEQGNKKWSGDAKKKALDNLTVLARLATIEGRDGAARPLIEWSTSQPSTPPAEKPAAATAASQSAATNQNVPFVAAARHFLDQAEMRRDIAAPFNETDLQAAIDKAGGFALAKSTLKEDENEKLVKIAKITAKCRALEKAYQEATAPPPSASRPADKVASGNREYYMNHADAVIKAVDELEESLKNLTLGDVGKQVENYRLTWWADLAEKLSKIACLKQAKFPVVTVDTSYTRALMEAHMLAEKQSFQHATTLPANWPSGDEKWPHHIVEAMPGQVGFKTTIDTRTIRTAFDECKSRLSDGNEQGIPTTLIGWRNRLAKHLAEASIPRKERLLNSKDKWLPERLTGFERKVDDLVVRAEGERLVNALADQAEKAAKEQWGIATMVPSWADPISSSFEIEIPPAADRAVATAASEKEREELKRLLGLQHASSGTKRIPAAADHNNYQVFASCIWKKALMDRVPEDGITDILGKYPAETIEPAVIRNCQRAVNNAIDRYQSHRDRAWDTAIEKAGIAEFDNIENWDKLAQLAENNQPARTLRALISDFRSQYKEPASPTNARPSAGGSPEDSDGQYDGWANLATWVRECNRVVSSGKIERIAPRPDLTITDELGVGRIRAVKQVGRLHESACGFLLDRLGAIAQNQVSQLPKDCDGWDRIKSELNNWDELASKCSGSKRFVALGNSIEKCCKLRNSPTNDFSIMPIHSSELNRVFNQFQNGWVDPSQIGENAKIAVGALTKSWKPGASTAEWGEPLKIHFTDLANQLSISVGPVNKSEGIEQLWSRGKRDGESLVTYIDVSAGQYKSVQGLRISWNVKDMSFDDINNCRGK